MTGGASIGAAFFRGLQSPGQSPLGPSDFPHRTGLLSPS